MKTIPLVFLFVATLLFSAPTFTPPSVETRIEALGEIQNIDPSLRPLFQDTTDFSPIPEPGSIDWLSSQHEPGQTFDQFESGRFNIPDSDHPYLYLQPIGEDPFPPRDYRTARHLLYRFFQYRSQTAPAPEG